MKSVINMSIENDEHLNKFQRMKIRHPERYKYCMEQLGLKELCEYANIPIE